MGGVACGPMRTTDQEDFLLSNDQIEKEIIDLSHKFAEDQEAFFFFAASKILDIPEIECVKRFRSALGMK